MDLKEYRWTNKWLDGGTDKQMGRRTDGRTDGWAHQKRNAQSVSLLWEEEPYVGCLGRAMLSRNTPLVRHVN